MVAAIYARKSTPQPGVSDEAKSVTRQVEHARAYARQHGWTVADDHIYVDDDMSGAEFDRRPGFLRLMKALWPRAPFGVLILSEASRLGREQFETGYALKQLSKAGVRCFSYLQDREIELETATDKFLMSAVTFADELEREKARMRTYDALHRKARSGYVTGGRVFGYDNVRDPIGVRRVVNEAEAAVVRRIFTLAAEGYGLTRIAKTLNADYAPCPRPQQGRPAGWAPSSVRDVLYRPLYRGEILWNQSRKRNSWGEEQPHARPRNEWVRVDAPELAILTEAQWSAAHAQMDAQRVRYSQISPRGAPPWSTEAKYLLTGLLQCTVCRGGMEARSRSHGGQRAVFYGCAAYHRGGRSVCPNALTVPMMPTDDAVLSALETSLLHPRVIEAAVRQAVNRLCHGSAFESIADVRRELKGIEAELTRLSAAVAAGGELASLVAAIQQREEHRRALQDRVRQLQVRDVGVVDADGVVRDLHARLEEWRTLLHENTSTAHGLLKRLIVGRLEMTPASDRSGYAFRGIGTMLPVVGEVVPHSVASPTGFEPVFWP